MSTGEIQLDEFVAMARLLRQTVASDDVDAIAGDGGGGALLPPPHLVLNVDVNNTYANSFFCSGCVLLRVLRAWASSTRAYRVRASLAFVRSSPPLVCAWRRPH